jgi:Family of unknown function (DUF5313)
MSRLPGNPGIGRWLWYALGFRLPPANSEWVRHDLTDAGWRVRLLARQFVYLVPVAALFMSLPGPWELRGFLAALIVVSGLFIGLTYGDTLRAARLRQHRLPVPTDPDLGRPTDES